jgi:hypothetical protein
MFDKFQSFSSYMYSSSVKTEDRRSLLQTLEQRHRLCSILKCTLEQARALLVPKNQVTLLLVGQHLETDCDCL